MKVKDEKQVNAKTIILTGLFKQLLNKVGFEGKNEQEIHKCILIAMQHAVKMSALDIPKPGNCENYQLTTHTFAYGIYPQLENIIWTLSFIDANCFSFRKNDRLIIQTLRKMKSGENVKVLPLEGKDAALNGEGVNGGLNDLITFRCSGDECEVGFPLKENTKEKLIKCPMCQKETNIWLKLKKIQV